MKYRVLRRSKIEAGQEDHHTLVMARSSDKEHQVDALALGAEEGRDKLRKAAGRSKYPTIRRYPNEGTQLQ